MQLQLQHNITSCFAFPTGDLVVSLLTSHFVIKVPSSQRTISFVINMACRPPTESPDSLQLDVLAT